MDKHEEQVVSKELKSENKSKKPFLKWAGGKRQLLKEIKLYIPENFKTYYEPFLGGGAVLFELEPKNGIVNDTNPELINCYEVIKHFPEELIEDIKKHKNEKDYFYKIRELDRDNEYDKLTNIERASRIIYLNKTCFNGLFRVNLNGQFNAPFGRYKNPKYIDEANIYNVSSFLKENEIQILNEDFEKAVEDCKRNDFVYMDPPYYPLSDTSSFLGYNINQFGKKEQERLRDVFENLTMKGCKIMMSNSASNFIKELYKDFNIIKVPAKRSINAIGSGRGKIDEFLILNYSHSK